MSSMRSSQSLLSLIAGSGALEPDRSWSSPQLRQRGPTPWNDLLRLPGAQKTLNAEETWPNDCRPQAARGATTRRWQVRSRGHGHHGGWPEGGLWLTERKLSRGHQGRCLAGESGRRGTTCGRVGGFRQVSGQAWMECPCKAHQLSKDGTAGSISKWPACQARRGVISIAPPQTACCKGLVRRPLYGTGDEFS